MIAWNVVLLALEAKPMEKTLGGPNWFGNRGFVIFSRLHLGTTSKPSRDETSKKNVVTEIWAEMIFSILMSPSIHSNLLVCS